MFTGGGNPVPLMPFLKQAGVKIIPVVPYARLAVKMEQAGADAVLAASVFHSGHLTIGQVKAAMAAEGISVR